MWCKQEADSSPHSANDVECIASENTAADAVCTDGGGGRRHKSKSSE